MDRLKVLGGAMFAIALTHASANASEDTTQPQGWLFQSINDKPLGIQISGWAQASVAGSNHGGQMTPATIFRQDEGLTLDQVAITIEKS